MINYLKKKSLFLRFSRLFVDIHFICYAFCYVVLACPAVHICCYRIPVYEATRHRRASLSKYIFKDKCPEYGNRLLLDKCKGCWTLCVAGIIANYYFAYNLCKHVEEAYAFHDLCLTRNT